MSLKERVYSILIVSAVESFNTAFLALLSDFTYQPIQIVTSISAAKRALSECSYDYVLINAPLPDDMGTRFAIDTCSSKETVVLLLVKSDIHDAIHDKVAEYGVFTLPKPTSRQAMLQALNWMESARERLRQLQNKTLSVEEKMAEIRIVNKAKWLLITELKMSEPDAHRYIEKQAMDRCVSKKEVAEEIIRTYS